MKARRRRARRLTACAALGLVLTPIAPHLARAQTDTAPRPPQGSSRDAPEPQPESEQDPRQGQMLELRKIAQTVFWAQSPCADPAQGPGQLALSEPDTRFDGPDRTQIRDGRSGIQCFCLIELSQGLVVFMPARHQPGLGQTEAIAPVWQACGLTQFF